MRRRKSRYQQGSIKRFKRARGCVWQVRFPVCASQVRRSHCSIPRDSSTSRSALSYCSWVMAALWKAAVFSAKEIPFPLIEDVSTSVDEAQQLGPECVHGASDL